MVDKYEASELIGGSFLFVLSVWRIVISDYWVETFVPDFFSGFGLVFLSFVTIVGMGVGALMITGKNTRELSIISVVLILGVAVMGVIRVLNTGDFVAFTNVLYLVGIASFYLFVYLLHTDNHEETKIYPVE